MNAPNANQEHRASALLQTDWDSEGTTSVSLPEGIARQLLSAAGYRIEKRSRVSNGNWGAQPDAVVYAVHSPSGERYWDVQEALTHALVSQVMDR